MKLRSGILLPFRAEQSQALLLTGPPSPASCFLVAIAWASRASSMQPAKKDAGMSNEPASEQTLCTCHSHHYLAQSSLRA